MGFIQNFFHNNSKSTDETFLEVDINEQALLNEKGKSDRHVPMNKKKIKDFLLKAVIGLQVQSQDRERFERPEYNL